MRTNLTEQRTPNFDNFVVLWIYDEYRVDTMVLQIQTILHRIPDPVFKVPDPDPAWIWPNIEKVQNIFVILISSKLIQDFYQKIIIYKNRILPYYTI